MNTSTLWLLRLSTLLVLVPALGGPAYGHFKFLSAESETYQVELISWERYGAAYSDVRFDLLVREKGTKAERTVTVENLTTGLEEAEVIGRTLVLFGERRSKAGAITLVDLETAEVSDFILHYGASLSPNRRYLVFKAFYPPYGMLQGRSDTVRVYDLSKGPSENRLSGAGDSASGQSVGLPVYPLENVDPPTYLVWQPEESQRHYVDPQAGFLWANDERFLIFIDKTRSQQHLVRVDLREGLSHPRITTRAVEPTPALAIDSQDLEGSSSGERKYLAVTGMKFESDGRIRLELDREFFERGIYRVIHLSVEPPEAASLQEGAVEP
ncbi:MAG: hypothetical protein GY722_18900 [bacterium]|nr:hypothetical protein [bacterium]